MPKELIYWSEGYNVNIKVIDDQHKKLIDLINRLYNIYLDQTQYKDIDLVIKEIKEYSLYHFKTEEDLFKKHNYKHTSEHSLIHRSFIEEFEKIIQSYEKQNLVLTMKTMTFLQRWLTNHILKEDKKYMGYIL